MCQCAHYTSPFTEFIGAKSVGLDVTGSNSQGVDQSQKTMKKAVHKCRMCITITETKTLKMYQINLLSLFTIQYMVAYIN